MIYKVVFIDEEEDAHDDFMKVINLHNKAKPDLYLEGLPVYPKSTLEKMVGFLLAESPDAVITDFQLNEKKNSISYNVLYNGSDLAENFLKVKDKFPFFITTSYEQHAANKSQDVNLVYVKDNAFNRALHRSTDSFTFMERVYKQIEHYKKYIEVKEDRFNELFKKKYEEQLSVLEEQELLKIDSILESAIDGRAAIPDILKSPSHLNKLSDLLYSIEELLREFKNEK